MITFKQYLKEEKAMDLEDFVALLKKDCAPYFAERHPGNLLWRGIKTDPGTKLLFKVNNSIIDVAQRDIRKDRKPKDTPAFISTLLDDWFEDKFNVRARTKSMFCYGDGAEGKSHSGMYGSPYIVFPIGEMKCIWSPLVNDLTFALAKKFIISAPVEAEKINEFLDNQQFTDQNLAKAMNSNSEIMIVASSYYAVNTDLMSDADLLKFTRALK